MIIKKNKKGVTFVELLIVLVLFSIVIAAVGYTYFAGIKLYNLGYDRSSVQNELTYAAELISKNLRRAKSIDAITASSITFTADLGSGDQSYRAYLYNSSDAEPNPPYSASTYELRWASGVVTYGSGVVLARNITQPVNTPFSQTSNLITMDWTVVDGDQSLRLRTNVRPRNL